MFLSARKEERKRKENGGGDGGYGCGESSGGDYGMS